MVRHEAYETKYAQSRWELALREWHTVEPEKEKRYLQLRFFFNTAKLIFTRLFSRVFHCCIFYLSLLLQTSSYL